MLLPACSILRRESSDLPGVRVALLTPNVHGRLVSRTMEPRYITIHSTANVNVTAVRHADYLLVHGNRSQKNARLGRSGWVTWHFTVDDREVVQHLLPIEQGDHADYGGPGDRQSIGVEICEFRNRARQSAAIDRGMRLHKCTEHKSHAHPCCDSYSPRSVLVSGPVKCVLQKGKHHSASRTEQETPKHLHTLCTPEVR